MDFSELREKIRQANDIVNVIGSRITLKKAGGDNYIGLCPFHNEKTPSFNVSRSKQMYHCFGCHKGGDVFKFIEEYENTTFREAMEILASEKGIEIPKFSYNNYDFEKYKIAYDINKDSANFFHKMLKDTEGREALSYLKKRGLSNNIIFKFGLGFAPNNSTKLYNYLKSKYDDKYLEESGLFTKKNDRFECKFFNRVIFPITNERGKVIGFGGRVLNDAKPKYLNSPEGIVFNKRKNLYSLYQARKSKRRGIMLCEGYMDVIAMHMYGFDNAVASLGTALTVEQISIIKKYSNDLYLIFDSDEAGVNAAIRSIPIIKKQGLDAHIIDLRPYKDPDELLRKEGKDEFEKRIIKATNAILFLIEKKEENYNLTLPDEITKFQKDILEILLLITEPLELNNYIKKICNIYKWDERIFKKTLLKNVKTNEIKVSNKKILDDNRKKDNSDEGIIAAERVIIKLIAQKPSYKEEIKKYLREKDFHTKIYADLAKMLYNSSSVINGPLDLVKSFESDEYTDEISIIFNETNIDYSDIIKLNNTVKEAIIAIKNYNIEREYPDDELLTEDKLLQKFNDLKLVDTIKKIKILLYEEDL